MHTKVGFLLVTALCLSATVSGKDAKYSMVTLHQVHAGRTLQSLLTVYYTSPENVQVTVQKVGSSTQLLTSTKPVTGDGAVNAIDINIPSDFEEGKYMMNVSNKDFTASATFKVLSVPYAILIQTDKPIYKPSQTVNIRIAVIDDNLIPRNESVDVIIEDSEGNKIQQWKNLQTKMGLAQISLPLSDRPPLGDWTITVSNDEVEKEKTVKIDEYVLPRFEVTVDLPSYLLKKANSLACTVTAQYTFGEDVKGDLKVVFKSNNGEVTKGNLKIDGSTTVTLNRDDLNAMGLSSGLVTAEAFVYEPLSNKTLNGSGSTELAVSDYLVTFMDINSKNYRPGQDYNVYFDVGKPDGARIKGESNKLSVTVTAYSGRGTWTPVTYTQNVPDSGVVPFTLRMPSVDFYSPQLMTELTLENGEKVAGTPTVSDLAKFQMQDDSLYLQMSSDVTGVPEVGSTVNIEVASSQTSGPFSYMVTSRGRVVAYETGQLLAGSASFSIPVTQAFTPQAYVVVSAIVGGELLADSITFSVEGTFQNEVTVEFTNSQGQVIEQSKPGDQIKVKVATDAGSTVGLMSVDKSVLLLAGGNDISQAQILSELMSLVRSESSCGDSDEEVVPFFFCWFPMFGGKSSEDILWTAGVSVSTDAVLSGCSNDYDDILKLDSGPIFRGPDDAPKKRQFFPETWLWNLIVSEDGSLVLDETVPDTITSWVTTALSMHPTTGIAVTAQSTELTVKLPFFITAILPYSAVKGEELELKIVVNNYGDADDTCRVTIEGSDQYEAKASENDLYMPGKDLELASVSVSKGAGVAVVVWLNPRQIDTIKISASATCNSGASDAFQRDLLVKPPGFPQEHCESKFVQLESGDADVSVAFNIYVDGDYVEDSKRVQVQVTGDVMGPSIEGLESLVRMPYGCGEQNMISFTPNIFVRAYLEHMNDLDQDIKAKTTKYMQTGYQRELTYKHTDGSFSAFGNSDPSGSTWLTAFVMKCFRQASLLIEIDLGVLQKSMDWLNNQKSSTTPGMFDEPGVVLHADMQGGSSGGITLTAFVVIAMLEDVTGAELTSRINSLSTTITYLENSLTLVEGNAYQLSIITYALQLAQSNQVPTFLTKLESLQKTDGGLVWWEKTGISVPDSNGRYKTGPSGVEMTSYALLTYISRSDINKAKAVAMWLAETRSSSGGYYSTQDTVLGLQSLAAYAKLVISNTTNLQVDFETNMADTYSHTITNQNAIITKKHSFKPATDINKVSVKISGEGSTIVTACTGYNVRTVPKEPTTVVTTNINRPSKDSANANLEACITYVGGGASGMGLTQILFPTGYSASIDDLVKTVGDMARAEATGDGLAVYWHEITTQKSCVNVTLVQDTKVNSVEDSYVMGTQYYNTESGSRSFYNPQSAPLVEDDGKTDDGTGGTSSLTAMLGLTFLVLLLHLS